jgi:hypothetical protein
MVSPRYGKLKSGIPAGIRLRINFRATDKE